MKRLALGACAALWLWVPLQAAAAVGAATPVLLAADEECEVSVDGESVGSIPANGTKKIQLAPGEHLVTAACRGNRAWRQVISVGDQQKVVNIVASLPAPPAAAATPAGAPAAAPAAPPKAYTGVAKVVNRGGRWTVHAVVKDSPAYKAGVRAGTILVSVEGKRAKDLTFEALSAMDEGPLGSSLSAEILDRDDSFRSLSVERAELPEVGTMEVLLVDGKSTREVAYTGQTFQAAANTGVTFPGTVLPGVGVPGVGQAGALGTPIGMTCSKCGKKPVVYGSLYCVDHKCGIPTCLAQEILGGDYCPAHKCSQAFCTQAKSLGSDKCWAHRKS